MSKQLRSIALALSVLAVVFPVFGDTLRLRDGSIIAGSWLGGGAREVRFLVNDQIQIFPIDRVAEVTFGAGAPRAPPPPRITPEPDVVGAVFFQDTAGAFYPLERTYAMQARSPSPYGPYGGGSMVYRINGTRSPFRVRSTDRLLFVVKLQPGRDPRRFQMYPLQIQPGYRQTWPARGGVPPTIPVSITKITDTTYGIAPARALAPGEYSISPTDSNDTFCFGVD
jgi:hypothetical protein